MKQFERNMLINQQGNLQADNGANKYSCSAGHDIVGPQNHCQSGQHNESCSDGIAV